MSVYKSKFQPIMERWSLVLKIVLLTTGLMFLLRTFMLQSLQDQIASLLLGIILVSIYIYMLIGILYIGIIFSIMGTAHYTYIPQKAITSEITDIILNTVINKSVLNTRIRNTFLTKHSFYNELILFQTNK